MLTPPNAWCTSRFRCGLKAWEPVPARFRVTWRQGGLPRRWTCPEVCLSPFLRNPHETAPLDRSEGHLLATGILLKSNWQSATHIALRRKEPYFSNTCWGTLRGRYQLFRMKGPHRFEQQLAEDSHDNGLIGGNNWSQKEHPCLGWVLHQPALRFCHQRFSVLLATGSL